jgi:hypothetical protein
MAIYPHAVQLLLPESETQPHIEPRVAVMHTAVDGENTTTLAGVFGPSQLESHFYVRRDGTVEQYMDTNTRADAMFDANAFGVSIETWDGAASTGSVPRWNDDQVPAIVALLRWLCDTHPAITRQLADGPYGSGLGYHCQFHEWARDGHTCPTQIRVDQFLAEILPAVISDPTTAAPTSEEDDMAMPEIIVHRSGTHYWHNWMIRKAISPSVPIDWLLSVGFGDGRHLDADTVDHIITVTADADILPVLMPMIGTGGQTVDVAALVTAIQGLPAETAHQVLVELGNALPKG